jgi:RNA polymerase sigma factor (sigma-70 family)
MRFSQSSDAPSTCATLIWLLGNAAQPAAAWDRFVAIYGPVILEWCRQCNLQEADACDVTQETLLRLAKCLPTFEYNPDQRFRGWLRTVVQHCLNDWCSARRQLASGSGDTGVLQRLESVPAREQLVERIERQFDQELLQLAMQRVRGRVEPQTWLVFELLAIQELSGVEVARRTGLKIASAFATRSKVQRLLRTEIDSLRDRRRSPA